MMAAQALRGGAPLATVRAGSSRAAAAVQAPKPAIRSRSSFLGKHAAPPRRALSGRVVRAEGRKPAITVAVAVSGEGAPIKGDMVTIDNSEDPNYTVITVNAPNKPGLLTAVTATFRDLGLEVTRANVEMENSTVHDTFYITDLTSNKITNEEDINNVRLCVQATLDQLLSQGLESKGARPFVPKLYQGSKAESDRAALVYNLMDTYIRNDVLSIQASIVNHVEYTLARSRYRFDDFEAYQATSYSVRDRLIESWNDTMQHFREQDPKRVYYLSMEFLMGRSLLNSVYNLGVKDQYTEAVRQLGYDLEVLAEQERDAALGNGGLGRLAACFLDSMASLNLPAWGYGIRYQYGMFRQSIQDGFQRENPDYWLNFGNPWEVQRPNVIYPVKFYGHVSAMEEKGRQSFKWNPGETVDAVAYDNPIPGYDTPNTINLRLWSAKPSSEFDLESFNTGDYVSAILAKQRAETISSVLYPDDRTYEGKELRLKQQHFFVSATIQDVVRRYKETHPEDDFNGFGDKVALQLNDTHPTIGVAEVMRVFMDEEGLGWTKSWDITQKVFSFTNHTVLPEALEKWPVELVEQLLPRHMQIIYDINWRHIQDLRSRFGDDYDRIGRMSIIEENDDGKFVRMAFLALVASHTVNGVAAIHSDLIKTTIFKEFYEIWPEKFQNKTNGVTQRRWLAFCNPGQGELITKALGNEEWKHELDLLQGLRATAEDKEFQAEWRAVKRQNKERLAKKIEELTGVAVSPDAMFDIQVKRIHEYKRQLLNVLSVISRYDKIKRASPEERKEMVPRVVCIGGKAAPGYEMAKKIIKLISAVGDVINSDPEVGDLLKLVFVPDYNVSLAEIIVPGSDLSQENMFIFGAREEQVQGLRASRATYEPIEEYTKVLNMIRSGTFGWPDFFAPICDNVSGGSFGNDYYLLANDFETYLEEQAKADACYKDQDEWTRRSILMVAGSGKFSSDRTIREYAKDIWGVEPCRRPGPDRPLIS